MTHTTLGSSPDAPPTPSDDLMWERVQGFNHYFAMYGLEAEWWRDQKFPETVHIRVLHDTAGVLFETEWEWSAVDAFDAFEMRALDLLDAALARAGKAAA